MKNNYYDEIAKDYDLKRKKPWKALIQFLDNIKLTEFRIEGISIDLGCANGRHFEILTHPNNKLIGIDNSIEFLKLSKKKKDGIKSNGKHNHPSNFISLLLADMQNLPIRKNTITNIISVASIHHVRGKSNRQCLIDDLKSILQDEGFLVISVWRKWQEKYKSFFLKDRLMRKQDREYRAQQNEQELMEHGDKYITWTLSKKQKEISRFYHFFSAVEFKRLLKDFDILKFEMLGGPTSKDNFFVLAQKSG